MATLGTWARAVRLSHPYPTTSPAALDLGKGWGASTVDMGSLPGSMALGVFAHVDLLSDAGWRRGGEVLSDKPLVRGQRN